ncbi:MAG: alpha/beta hydrolase family protein [Deltaproteobacteria bacterium]
MRLVLLTVALGLSLSLGCGQKQPSPADAGPPQGPHALWSTDPQSLSNPFPDGRLVDADGGVLTRQSFWQPFAPAALVAEGASAFPAYLGQLGASLETTDGFGNFAAELIPFSALPDAASLATAFAYVRLGASPKLGPSAVVSLEAAMSYARVHPSGPLDEATEWALALTDAATSGGAPLVPSPDFWAWENGAGAAQVAQIASALGTSPKHIVFAMVFATSNARADLEAVVPWIAQPLQTFPSLTVAAQPLTQCGSGAQSVSGQCPEGVFSSQAANLAVLDPWFHQEGWESAPTDVGTVVIGALPLKDLRDGEQGHFQAASVADPSGARDVTREFVLALPNPATVPMPPGGYPLVVAGHGLGGGNSIHENGSGGPDPTFCLSKAEWLAQAGYGCIGIDAPSHQSRGSPAAFFDLQDLTVTRDYFREMAFDMMQVMRVAASWPQGLYGVTIDPSRVGYLGESLGGIMGATFVSLDPRVTGGVLLVPGGGLSTVLQSPNIEGSLGLLVAVSLGLDLYTADGGFDPNFQTFLPVVQTLAQILLESGDPINYAPTLAPSKHFLLIEGLDDQTIPNEATDDLSQAFGIPALTAAAASDGGVSGLWKYDLAHYGFTNLTKDNPHGVFELVPAARAQAGSYLSSGFTDIVPEN